MKTLRHFTTLVCPFFAPFAIADTIPLAAGEEPAPFQQRADVDVRALLEKCLASDSLPEGMVIRQSACLGELDEKGVKDRLPASMSERWEFTSDQVRRVERKNEDDKEIEQVESRPFDSKGLCRDLLEGKSIEIAAEKGEGPKVGFVGSRYQRGSRYIEVVWKGETILELSETNGPFLKLYRESDARDFGALYEGLARKARVTFETNTAVVK